MASLIREFDSENERVEFIFSLGIGALRHAGPTGRRMIDLLTRMRQEVFEPTSTRVKQDQLRFELALIEARTRATRRLALRCVELYTALEKSQRERDRLQRQLDRLTGGSE